MVPVHAGMRDENSQSLGPPKIGLEHPRKSRVPFLRITWGQLGDPDCLAPNAYKRSSASRSRGALHYKKAIVGTKFDYPEASTIKARFPLLLSRVYGVSVDHALHKMVVAERDVSACRVKLCRHVGGVAKGSTVAATG